MVNNINISFLYSAFVMSRSSTCLRKRFGSVVVVRDKIVGSGCNKSSGGIEGCTKLRKCFRVEHKIKSGTRMDLCRSVTSEQSAVLDAGRLVFGGTLYTFGTDIKTNKVIRAFPHVLSIKFLIYSGITNVVISTPDTKKFPYTFETIDLKDPMFLEDKSFLQL